MHTIINPKKPSNTAQTESAESFRDPHYDCMQTGNILKLVVYVPGVASSGVEIAQQGPDLVVTGRKAHLVRVNWRALHLEGVQRDYRLRLRLGNQLDYRAIRAEINDGVLTIAVPKLPSSVLSDSSQRVA